MGKRGALSQRFVAGSNHSPSIQNYFRLGSFGPNSLQNAPVAASRADQLGSRYRPTAPLPKSFQENCGFSNDRHSRAFAAGSDRSLDFLRESLESVPVEPGNALSGARAWRAAISLFPNYWTPSISALRVVMSAPNSVRSGKPRSR